jgi:hypothetical protein
MDTRLFNLLLVFVLFLLLRIWYLNKTQNQQVEQK